MSYVMFVFGFAVGILAGVEYALWLQAQLRTMRHFDGEVS